VKPGAGTVRGARAWQTFYRTVSVLSGTACAVTVIGSAHDLLTTDVSYQEASIEIVVVVATLVLCAFTAYALAVHAGREMEFRAAGQDDTEKWLPPNEVPNGEGLRQVKGVFWRLAALVAVGLAGSVLLIGFDVVRAVLLFVAVVFWAPAARWLARFREVARTGWRKADVRTVSRTDMVVTYEDGSEITLRRPVSVRGWTWGGLGKDIWIGGAGRHMVVLFPRGRLWDRHYAVPARGRTVRTTPSRVVTPTTRQRGQRTRPRGLRGVCVAVALVSGLVCLITVLGTVISQLNPGYVAEYPGELPSELVVIAVSLVVAVATGRIAVDQKPKAPTGVADNWLPDADGDRDHLTLGVRMMVVRGVGASVLFFALAVTAFLLVPVVPVITGLLVLFAVVTLVLVIVYVVATVNWWLRYRSVRMTAWYQGDAELDYDPRNRPHAVVRYPDQSQVRLRQAPTRHSCAPHAVLVDDQRVWVAGTDSHMVVYFPRGRRPGEPVYVPMVGKADRRARLVARHSSGSARSKVRH
jgi:hypothetical protein